MEDLFRQFWRLIFPVMGMVYGLVGMLQQWRKMLASRRCEVRARERDQAYCDLEQGDGPLDPALRAALAKALAALSLDQRACVAMCLAAGYSHTEAAHALAMPLGTVKSHVLRGREKLSAALGDSDGG